MKLAPPGSTRGRRADSIISSAMSDTSEGGDQTLAARKKASRVSFSDVDETETRSRNPSPNKMKSAMKAPGPSQKIGRGGPVTSLPAPLQRRASNGSIRSNSGAMPAPAMASAQVVKHTEIVPKAEDDGDLSTIASNSAYGDAEEDFAPSPALARNGVLNGSSVPLTKRNLATVNGDAASDTSSPIKSALKKPSSQAGSARMARNPPESDLDGDVDSDDSFDARRRAKKVGGRKTMSATLREPETNTPNSTATNTAINGATARTVQPPRPVSRAASISSQTSRMSQEPRRMLSLRQNPPERRQSLQGSRMPSYEQPMQRRASIQSLRTAQPPIPAKSARRGSVAGSVAESVRSEAVNSHLAVMERAQANVQKMLHGGAVNPPDTVADAPERRSSFERRRPSGLTRRLSSSSMTDRVSGMPTSLRSEAEISKIKHRRAASDDRAFFNSGSDRPKPVTTRSSSMVYTKPADTASVAPATPRKSRLRSFSFGLKKKPQDTNVPDLPRRFSDDSDEVRLPRREKPEGSVLKAGTLRNAPNSLPVEQKVESGAVTSARTGKVKKFQALRRFFHIKD